MYQAIADASQPQDYRDWSQDPFYRRLYFSYQYFFAVTQPSRNEHDGAIFAGTMGPNPTSSVGAAGWLGRTVRLFSRSSAGRLSAPQRWAYLCGAVQWYGDLMGVVFFVLMFGGAINLATGGGQLFRLRSDRRRRCCGHRFAGAPVALD